jgi:hypothetical protein
MAGALAIACGASRLAPDPRRSAEGMVRFPYTRCAFRPVRRGFDPRGEQ